MTNSRSLALLVVLAAALVPVLLNYFLTSPTQIQTFQNLKNYLQTDANITIPISLRFGDAGFQFPDLVEASQIQVDFDIQERMKGKFFPKIKLVNDLRPNRNISIEYEKDDKYVVELLLSDENSVIVDEAAYKAFALYTMRAVHANDLPFYIAQIINYNLLAPDMRTFHYGLNHTFDYSRDMVINFIYIGDKVVPEQVINHTSTQFKYFDNFKNFTNVTLTYQAHNQSMGKIPENLQYSYKFNRNIYLADKSPIQTLYANKVYSLNLNSSDSIDELDKVFLENYEIIRKNLFISNKPTENIAIKVLAITRYHTLLGLISSIDEFIRILQLQKEIDLTDLTTHFYQLVDELEQTVYPNDWFNLLYKTKSLYDELCKII